MFNRDRESSVSQFLDSSFTLPGSISVFLHLSINLFPVALLSLSPAFCPNSSLKPLFLPFSVSFFMLWVSFDVGVHCAAHTHFYFYAIREMGGGEEEEVEESEMEYRRVGFLGCLCVFWGGVGKGCEWKRRQSLPPSFSLPLYHFQVDYMDENEEYFQRQASHRQSRRRFRKINQKGERQTIIDTVDPYPTGKPPIARGYHTVSCTLRYSFVFTLAVVDRCVHQRWLSVALCLFSVCVSSSFFRTCCAALFQNRAELCSLLHQFHVFSPFGGLSWPWVL